MWALGVITYIMLCGFAPFRSADRSQSKLFEAIKRGIFVYLSPYWDPISQSAKDLINRLLVVSPKRRLSAQETLVHPWVFSEGVVCRSDDLHSSSAFEQRRLAYQMELENQANLVALERQRSPNRSVTKLDSNSGSCALPRIEPNHLHLSTGKNNRPANSYSPSAVHLPSLPSLR
ncbi:unnamed protein product [Echinostoma caproni]|uniref:Protein kinase domain-containing protein n=1 Tax=Echinostoma caproni TaxID=27848 RepID=A0A183AHL9_9TREM|nr:unnamed protein product [Echinostoma caproni]